MIYEEKGDALQRVFWCDGMDVKFDVWLCVRIEMVAVALNDVHVSICFKNVENCFKAMINCGDWCD